MATEPDDIEPDGKDWTWVLDAPCPDCGFDATGVSRGEVGAAIRANAAEWTELLAGPSATTRPAAHQWSALEYACHVRDVHRLFEHRLHLMLAEDDPEFENWDQDVTAVEQRYDLQDPAAVLEELVAAAESHAAAWDAVGDHQWDRTGRRSTGSLFTVDSLARYMLHDPIHHVVDVRRGAALLDDEGSPTGSADG